MSELDVSEVVTLEADLLYSWAHIDDKTDAVLGAIAVRLHAKAREAAPVATGELAGSIYLRSERLARTIGTDEPQGFFQEFGTSRNPPQPWLYPAADSVIDDLVDATLRVADPLD